MQLRLVSWRLLGTLALLFVLCSLVFASAALASVTRYEEDSSNIAYTGIWSVSSLPGHSGGAVDYSSDITPPVGTATLTFNGTGVTWIAAKWYNRGIAAVSLDGGSETTVDLYSAGIVGDTSTVLYQQPVYSVSGLTNGPHTLTIRVTGDHVPAAASPYLITIDAFDVTVPDPPVSTPASSPLTLALVGVIGLGVLGLSARARAHARG